MRVAAVVSLVLTWRLRVNEEWPFVLPIELLSIPYYRLVFGVDSPVYSDAYASRSKDGDPVAILIDLSKCKWKEVRCENLSLS